MTVKTFLPRLRAVPGRVWARFRPFGKPLAIMTGLYTLGISAILRANYNYVDDMVRVYGGSKGWENYSRYLSNFLSSIIHADSYLTDVSPLPQLLACLILAAASVAVLYLVTGRERFTVWEYAAVLPLGLSPYMLECLSFKFDAPYMALSVLASVTPLLAVGKDAPRFWRICLSCLLGTLVMCLTYQAAAGILPMLTVLLAFRMWQRRAGWRDILRFIAAAAVGYCAAIVGYELFLVHPYIVEGHASSSLAPAGQLLPKALDTLRTYWTYILTDHQPLWLALMAAVCLAFLWTAARDTQRSRPLALALALAVIAALALLSFGVYPALDLPLIQPRTMYGFGAGLAFLAVSAASAKKALPGKAACLALAWCFFVFAFTYGDALFVQKTYTEFRMEEVIDAIKGVDEGPFSTDSTVLFQLKGDIGHAPALRRSIARFPLLGKLVPHTFGDYSWMTYYPFARYYGLPNLSWTGDDSFALEKFHLPVLDESLYHTIYGTENFLLIELK